MLNQPSLLLYGGVTRTGAESVSRTTYSFTVILPKDPVPGYYDDYSKNTNFVRM